MSSFANGLIINKSFDFAVRIVKLCQFLRTNRKDYVIIQQLLKSGTSIGANVREAAYAQSNNDFISKLSISIKEANETHYWLELAYSAEWINQQEYDSIIADCDEILKLLTASINTSKRKQSIPQA